MLPASFASGSWFLCPVDYYALKKFELSLRQKVQVLQGRLRLPFKFLVSWIQVLQRIWKKPENDFYWGLREK